jgi:hypothetical protein
VPIAALTHGIGVAPANALQERNILSKGVRAQPSFTHGPHGIAIALQLRTVSSPASDRAWRT